MKLKETEARLSHILNAEIKLDQFCDRLRQKLDNATIQDRRQALNLLDIRVLASTQKIELKGIIPIELTASSSANDVTTIAQTSGCMLNRNKKMPTKKRVISNDMTSLSIAL